MGCIGCSVSSNGSPNGCQNNGGCSTGGCNRLNTYDWLSAIDIEDVEPFDIVEVSFKNGARKGFYRNQEHTQAITGDMVVVETGNGLDVGRVTLSGELVRLQMRKKKAGEEEVLHSVIRRANERDLERLAEGREQEKPTMVRARVIARTLGLDMKIGDVEYQGDKRKATFYYTADGRVDFRELIRHYAKEFRVKVEMRQIGARQESARIGGLGSCGRELCCSTWLTDFKSVTTAAARYQNLAINQSKLSGMCGRLKCCLNYELDTYLDALDRFPRNADKLQTDAGTAVLIKTDIFKGLMYYGYEHENGRGKIFAIETTRAQQIRELNKKGEKPADLLSLQAIDEGSEKEVEMDFEDVTGAVELPEEEKHRKRRKKRRKSGGDRQGPPQNKTTNAKSSSGPRASGKRAPENKGTPEDKGRGGRSRRRGNKKKGGGNNNQNK